MSKLLITERLSSLNPISPLTMEDYELNEKDLKHTNASVAIQEVGSVDIDPIEERKLLKKVSASRCSQRLPL